MKTAVYLAQTSEDFVGLVKTVAVVTGEICGVVFAIVLRSTEK